MKDHACLNRFYRLRWSEAQGNWVAVAETSPAQGKPSARRRAVAALAAAMLSPLLAQAGPTGGQVQAGQGSITTAGSTTTVRQASPTLSLNWQGFNVGSQETVNFVQPSAAAIAVNRIADTNGSQILGRVNANGQVWLINPNGVFFGRNAQVNVGGLIASTLDVSDADLARSRRTFAGAGIGKVENQGTLRAGDGGYVALIGNQVSNQGTVSARLGTVALGAGSALSVTFDGNRLLNVQVDRSTLDNLAENRQLVQADGGRVIMTAGARDSLLASVVNNTGLIEARTIEQHEGSIVLLGGMQAGAVHLAGTLDASAPQGGNGGSVETSAAHVKVDDGAKVSTFAAQGRSGTWLIDPQDFTVAASGGDISGATLSSNLASGNVTLQSTTGAAAGNGDIFVNDAVGWNANTTLTLSAQRNIYFNAPVDASASASGKVALEYGQGAAAAGNTSDYFVHAPIGLPAGQNFSTRQGFDGAVQAYTVITSLGAPGSVTGTDLQGINGNTAGRYVLGSNIDASSTNTWNTGGGFTPIGQQNFTGTFDGLGHTINGLTANGVGWSGLFNTIAAGAVVRDLGLLSVSVSSARSVYGAGIAGSLAAVNEGTVYNVYSTGSVSSDGFITSAAAGLIGYNFGTVTSSFSQASVTGQLQTAGLVGQNQGSIANSYATGSVNGQVNRRGGVVSGWVGGLQRRHCCAQLFDRCSDRHCDPSRRTCGLPTTH